MAKLSNIKRILKEQLPSDVRDWIDNILFPFNTAISQFTYALTNQLTIQDNFLGSVKEFTLKTSDFPFTFSHGLNVKPKILFLGQIQEVTGGTPSTFIIGPVLQWEMGSSGSTIVIRTITGLDTSKSYNVTIVVLGT